MRAFLLALALPVVASAQPLDILSVEAPDSPRPVPGESVSIPVQVTIVNTGRVARFAYATAEAGGLRSVRVGSDGRLAPGDSTVLSVPVAIDLRTSALPAGGLPVLVEAWTNATTVADALTIRILPHEEAPPEAPPATLATPVFRSRPGVLSLPTPAAPSEPTVASLRLRFFVGGDNLRRYSHLYAQALDQNGVALSEETHLGSRSSEWAGGSLQVHDLPLRHSVPLGRVDRIVLRFDPSSRPLYGLAYDGAEITSVEIAVGPEDARLFRVEGAPWHRFTRDDNRRTLQIRPPARPVTQLTLRFVTGEDDFRDGSMISIQIFDTFGNALTQVIDPNEHRQTWPGGSVREITVPLSRAVAPSGLSRIDIHKRSVKRHILDTDDNWDLARLDVLDDPMGQELASWSGRPLFRFTGETEWFHAAFPR